MISGDIRTPMNAIIGFTSLAESHIDNREQTADYLNKIMTSSKHLLSLINDVLDMSRIESGKVVIEKKTMYLPEILRDIQVIIQSGINERQQKFVLDMEGLTDLYVEGDSLRLHQVLLNILGNAVKFTPVGGEICVYAAQNSTAPEGFADYEFRIRDNGIGMGKEFQKHIFEAFSREESSTVSGIQGTGLGMAITKNLVDMMGGRISVESEEGKGTEFTLEFRFAVSRDPAGQRERVLSQDLSGREKAVDFSGKRILIVEDNELNEEIAEAILEDRGFLVEAASDGREAVDKVKKSSDHYYDLILMDIQMPVMNGYEAARKIRAMEAGMNGHLAKPFEISKLMELLGQVLTDYPVSA